MIMSDDKASGHTLWTCLFRRLASCNMKTVEGGTGQSRLGKLVIESLIPVILDSGYAFLHVCQQL